MKIYTAVSTKNQGFNIRPQLTYFVISPKEIHISKRGSSVGPVHKAAIFFFPFQNEQLSFFSFLSATISCQSGQPFL